MEKWAEIRRRVLVDGLSKRAACRQYGVHWDTLTKILEHPEPPGYRRTAPRPRPKLDPFLGVIHQILQDDKTAPKKQRHTARRIFERLRDEHGYTGGLSIVKEAVAAWKARSAEVFVPLAHPPGEAQVDFGEAVIKAAGQLRKAAFLVMALPHSDAFVLDRDLHGIPPLERACPIDGGDADEAPVRHRVLGVDRQVEDCDVELGHVDVDGPQVARQGETDRDVFAQ